MNKTIKIFATIFLSLLVWVSCTPDEFELGKVDVSPDELVEGIAFSIEHDADNPNIVYLKSLMNSKYTPLWSHPQGRSQASAVTLKIPFEGTYSVRFGVQTRGGIVYGEPVTFTVDDFYAPFVEDEMWALLSGGVGESKTWIHDNGEYGLATGEMDYADPATVVEWNNFSPNWSPGKGHTNDESIWNNTITFSLIGAANVEVDYSTPEPNGTQESGTFMLDEISHTLTLTDAKIMHTPGWSFKTTNWSSNLKILTLTENQLRVAVLREEVSGESEWWMIWNYVSKEYADNYVPEETEDPVPPIDGDPNDVLTTTRTKVWTLSLDSPYDWADLNGGLLNNFTGGEDTYLSTGWAAYDPDMIAATNLTFTSLTSTGGNYTFDRFGEASISGTYSIAQNNDINFGQPLTAKISESDFGWTSSMYLNTTSENKLRILKTKADVFGNVTDMWLGQRSADKDEYMVFHFTPGGAAGPGDSSIEIAFDNSKMPFGDLEGNGNLRLELYNDFGTTVANPPLDRTKLVFSTKISVTFTLSGITLKPDATGNYEAKLSLADGDWNPQYWGEVSAGNPTVTGNGTYTAWYEPTSTSDGAVVFLIDILGLAADIEDIGAVTATIDSIKIE